MVISCMQGGNAAAMGGLSDLFLSPPISSTLQISPFRIYLGTRSSCFLLLSSSNRKLERQIVDVYCLARCIPRICGSALTRATLELELIYSHFFRYTWTNSGRKKGWIEKQANFSARASNEGTMSSFFEVYLISSSTSFSSINEVFSPRRNASLFKYSHYLRHSIIG